MSKEGTAPVIDGLTPSPSTIDTIYDIVSTVEQIISTGIEPIALVTIQLLYEKEEKLNTQRFMTVDQTTQYLLNELRALIRKTDSILQLGHNLYFLLHGANKQVGHIVQDRLWEALLWRVHSLSERDMMRPQRIAVGHSSFPMRNKTIRDFIAASEKATFCFETQPEKAARKHDEVPQIQLTKDELDQELPGLARKLGIP